MTKTLSKECTGNATQACNYAVPAVNIREDENAYVLEADLPGVGQNSLEITLEGSELTLVGRRTPEEQGGEALLRERGQADYRRVFEVAPTIDTTAITASMKQGLLTLTLPKSETVKPRRIQVSA